MYQQIYFGGLNHKYIIYETTHKDGRGNNQTAIALCDVNLFPRDLLFYCSIRSCKLSTKVTPLHAHRDTFFWAHVGLLAKNASKFQMLKCILDEFSIHTHLSWHTGNVIAMKRFGKIVWRQRLKNLEIHWRTNNVVAFGNAEKLSRIRSAVAENKGCLAGLRGLYLIENKLL